MRVLKAIVRKLASSIRKRKLLAAAKAGDVARAKKLLESGADTNTRDAHGQAALHFAACAGQTELARLLLAHNAEPNVEDPDGITPLELAAVRGHGELAKLLLKGGADLTMHVAAALGYVAKVQEFLAGGAELNGQDRGGQTPLHLAAWGGKPRWAGCCLTARHTLTPRSIGAILRWRSRP